MEILNRKNWWIWVLLFIFSFGTSNLVLASLLDVYDKNAWYTKWYNWFLGIIFMFFPAIIMLIVFMIQINVKIAVKLSVKGSNIYDSPFTWMLLLIIPIIGWMLFIVMLLYILLWSFKELYEGYGEQFNGEKNK